MTRSFLYIGLLLLAPASAGAESAFTQLKNRAGLPAAALIPAVSPEEKAFMDAARAVAARVRPDPGDAAALFTPAFVAAVGEGQIRAILSGFAASGGTVAAVEPIERTALSGSVRFRYADGGTQRVDLAVASLTDRRVSGMMFHPMSGPWRSMEEVLSELRKGPGKSGLQLIRLSDGKVLASHEPDAPLALGSAFKLYILQALSEKKLWDRPVTLREELKSWPSGVMQDLPAGTVLPARAYAAKMIGISDNTATDHLLDLVGRGDVEASLERLGNTHAALDRPFLATREIFWLKTDPARLKRWLAADGSARRAMLDELRGVVLGPPPDFDWSAPIAVDRLEWFGSPADVCRLLGTMDRRADPEVLSALARNPFLDFPKDRFSYAGFKGGSEPGVRFFAFLFKDKAGGSYCLAAGRTDTAAEVDTFGFGKLLQSLVYVMPR